MITRVVILSTLHTELQALISPTSTVKAVSRGDIAFEDQLIKPALILTVTGDEPLKFNSCCVDRELIFDIKGYTNNLTTLYDSLTELESYLYVTCFYKEDLRIGNLVIIENKPRQDNPLIQQTYFELSLVMPYQQAYI